MPNSTTPRPPGDPVENAAMDYVEEQNKLFKDKSPRFNEMPSPPWPGQDNAMLAYLIREAQRNAANEGLNAAIVQLATHCWMEGHVEALAGVEALAAGHEAEDESGTGRPLTPAEIEAGLIPCSVGIGAVETTAQDEAGLRSQFNAAFGQSPPRHVCVPVTQVHDLAAWRKVARAVGKELGRKVQTHASNGLIHALSDLTDAEEADSEERIRRILDNY